MSPQPLRFTDGVVTIRKFRRIDKFRMAEIANNEKVAANLRDAFPSDRKSTRLNSSHLKLSRMPSSA